MTAHCGQERLLRHAENQCQGRLAERDPKPAMTKEINAALDALAAAIEPADGSAASYIRSRKAKAPQQLADDLNFWGGSGSLMDRTPYLEGIGTRSAFEEAAAALARALVACGARNPRMESWLE
jgi:hypothetical protein